MGIIFTFLLLRENYCLTRTQTWNDENVKKVCESSMDFLSSVVLHKGLDVVLLLWFLCFMANQPSWVFVAERTSYFCLARKLIWPLWQSHIFPQWGLLIPFCSCHFLEQFKGGESAPNSLFLRIFRAGRTFLRSTLPSSRITSLWGEPSSLWTFVSRRSILSSFIQSS